jgi:uncharacterized protein (DUF2336 family)
MPRNLSASLVAGCVRLMGIGEFLLWIERARVDERCEAAQSIARTSLSQDLDLEERCMVEAALALLLDDPSQKVRRAIADVLSLSGRAPQQILHALAIDQHDVAAPVIARAQLSDDTLIAALSSGHSGTAALIADRARLSRRLALAIAEGADLRACMILVTNPQAACDETIFARIIARHAAHSGEMRGVLLSDSRLSLALRQKLIEATGEALCLSSFVHNAIGKTRALALQAESCAEAPLIMVEHAHPGSLPPYVRSLRDAGRLTSALIMKALVYGRIDFAATVLADLTNRNEEQVRSLLVRGGRPAIRALFKDVGIKGGMLDLACSAFDTWRDIASGKLTIGRQELAWQLMRQAEQARNRHENDDLAAFMRKIYLDIARTNAQEMARGVINDARREEEIGHLATAALENEFLTIFEEFDTETGHAPQVELVAELASVSVPDHLIEIEAEPIDDAPEAESNEAFMAEFEHTMLAFVPTHLHVERQAAA